MIIDTRACYIEHGSMIYNVIRACYIEHGSMIYNVIRVCYIEHGSMIYNVIYSFDKYTKERLEQVNDTLFELTKAFVKNLY